MQFHITPNVEEKLKSLSERLRYLARDNNSASSYTDRNIKSENLKFNPLANHIPNYSQIKLY